MRTLTQQPQFRAATENCRKSGETTRGTPGEDSMKSGSLLERVSEHGLPLLCSAQKDAGWRHDPKVGAPLQGAKDEAIQT